MRSGKKNVLVSVYKQVEAIDPHYNTPVYSSVLVLHEIFCTATPKRGREIEVDGQIISETYMNFDFDYFDVELMTEEMFIVGVEGGAVYDIKGILRDLTSKEWVTATTLMRPVATGRV